MKLKSVRQFFNAIKVGSARFFMIIACNNEMYNNGARENNEARARKLGARF